MEITHLGPLSDKDADLANLKKPSPATLGLTITENGETYRCTASGEFGRSSGPRLIESGTFFQRNDITDLVFTSDSGKTLNTYARLEAAGWTDRLSLILAVEPGYAEIPAGEASFGKVGGGFGLDGTNQFEIAPDPKFNTGKTTIEFWSFFPEDFNKASKHGPWLVCKNSNEASDGNIGITINSGKAQGRLNIGGGRKNAIVLTSADNRKIKVGAWNHLALTYDGEVFKIFVNGQLAGAKQVGKPLTHGDKPLVFGKRPDGAAGGMHFYGAIDQIRIYDRALDEKELLNSFRNPGTTKANPGQLQEWTFNNGIPAGDSVPLETWKDASMEITLQRPGQKEILKNKVSIPTAKGNEKYEPVHASITFDPSTFKAVPTTSPVKVQATEFATKKPLPYKFEPALGWHHIDLDGIEPIAPSGVENPSNDSIERIKLTVSNPAKTPQIARLMLGKTRGGFKQKIGSPITGVSAMLRDPAGNPTGIPVQLSKNWHSRPDYNGLYTGTWFNAISQLRLPAGSSYELELTICYGHWGGLPAASHAQLCLIGWGSNQHWQQSALGSWGESICYEPDQAQADTTVTDVRPSMTSVEGGDKWKWSGNVGGGDFVRLFDKAGVRIPTSAMKTDYHSYGPCRTEVEFSGKVSEAITHSETVSIARTDDLVRGTYRLRMDVNKATDFSRFVIFQVGSDTYNFTREKKMAIGNESGLLKEWDTKWGGDIYRTAPFECTGRIPWISLHKVAKKEDGKIGPFAQRGIIIRSWKAKLGGKETLPWAAEHGVLRNRTESSTIDIVPPPGVSRLEPGDFIEATFEHVIIPQRAEEYYGPNEALRKALTKDADSWKMMAREAIENDPKIKVTSGSLQQTSPSISIKMENQKADLTIGNGLSFTPVTFIGLTSYDGYTLDIDGKPLDQSVHGNDFWQTNYDPESSTWSRTYNLPIVGKKPHSLKFYRTK